MSTGRTCLAMLIACLLTGCAVPRVVLDRAVIRNKTRGTIRNVTVHHVPTNRIGSINVIPSGKWLDLGLPQEPMLASHAIVSWDQRDLHDHSTRLELPRDDEAARMGIPMSLVYTIWDSGNVTVALELPGGGLE